MADGLLGLCLYTTLFRIRGAFYVKYEHTSGPYILGQIRIYLVVSVGTPKCVVDDAGSCRHKNIETRKPFNPVRNILL